MNVEATIQVGLLEPTQVHRRLARLLPHSPAHRQPTDSLMKIAGLMFKDAWDQRLQQAQAILSGAKQDIAQIDKQIEQVLNRIMESSSTTVFSAFKKRIDKWEHEKLVLSDRLSRGTPSKASNTELFELSMALLASPWKLWEKNDFVLKRTLLRMAFSECEAYRRKTGLRTPQTSLPFKVLAAMGDGKGKMVHPERFERPALRFVV